MRFSPSVLRVASASVLTLAACNPFHQRPVTEVTRDVNLNARWRAALVTPAALGGAVQINGNATMQPGKSGVETDITIEIANATPGGVHPWQVHRGQCGSDDGVLGLESAYPSFRVGDDGRGSSRATIALVMPSNGSYFVTVQASAANSTVVLACGNLAAPAA